VAPKRLPRSDIDSDTDTDSDNARFAAIAFSHMFLVFWTV
jgi:hypothetical protein